MTCCDNDQVDWAARQAACTPVDVLLMLKERAQHDVAQYNEKRRTGSRFDVHNDREDMFNVTIRGPGRTSTEFRLDGFGVNIVVRVGGHLCDHFWVHPTWDADSATCLLAIHDRMEGKPEPDLNPKPRELWQISQRALSPLFFR